MKIRFDSGPDGSECTFDAPLEIIRAETAGEVAAALEELDSLRARGHWLAGYATYELGYALEPRLANRMPDGRRLPLLQFGAYERPLPADALANPGAALSELRPVWDAARYGRAFDRVKELIGAGDIYQANLTFPVEAETADPTAALYAALRDRQPVGHGALIEQDGLPSILSRSPELFFRTDENGLIETRPMKGTQPRQGDPKADDQARRFLEQDAKNRAENLMIVDLLRNDISRVAEPGSVRVPELFAIESYATVHQMVSRVEAQLRPSAGLGEIFSALFPCGSITGAPKIRAMEILRALEPAPRDVYCGTIGWAAPDGRSCFNVAIRTMMLDHGRVTFNVGGGVVWDSTAQSEYEEALWKARFAQLTTPVSA